MRVGGAMRSVFVLVRPWFCVVLRLRFGSLICVIRGTLGQDFCGIGAILMGFFSVGFDIFGNFLRVKFGAASSDDFLEFVVFGVSYCFVVLFGGGGRGGMSGIVLVLRVS
jgi:hypothetical protein